MKAFDTFIREQKGLLVEQTYKSTRSDPKTANQNKTTMAGLHGNTVVINTGSHPSLINSIDDKAVYDMRRLLKHFSSLSKMVIRPEEAKKLENVITDMETSHRKNNLIKQMQNLVTLPASADRTKRVQQFMNNINNIALETQQGSTDYVDYSNPSDTFIPYKSGKWN